jgi:hypothetical protein
MYSPSVVERETLFCLVLDQLRPVPPMRYTYPDVDLRSGRFPLPIDVCEAHKREIALSRIHQSKISAPPQISEGVTGMP